MSRAFIVTGTLVWMLSSLTVGGIRMAAGQGASDTQDDQLARLEERLVSDSTDTQAQRLLAEALYDRGELDEAADLYRLYLMRVQGEPYILKRYLVALSGNPGRYQEGASMAQRYLAYYPYDADLHMRLGFFQLWRGNLGAAEAAFKRALAYEPALEEAQTGLASTEEARALEQRLSSPPPLEPVPPEGYPELDERRFRFIDLLMRYNRYSDAYDQLFLLQPRHDGTRRWLALFAELDNRLVALTGTSRAFPADRFSYLLKNQPSDLTIRYQLVDALIEQQRIGEAFSILLDPRYIEANDPEYQSRLALLQDLRDVEVPRLIAEYESRLAADPVNRDVVLQLSDLYLSMGEGQKGAELMYVWLDGNPGDDAMRRRYALMLSGAGNNGGAFEQATFLLDQDNTAPANQEVWVRVSLAAGIPDERSRQFLQDKLSRDPSDVEALLDLSEWHLMKEDPVLADQYLRRAFTEGLPADPARVNALDLLVERALLRKNLQEQQAQLNQARELAQLGRYRAAIDAYEAYFDRAGKRTLPHIKELAEIHALNGNYLQALSILERVQQEEYTIETAKQIARYRYYLADHSGAIHTLEGILATHPADMEVREMLQQLYLEVQRYNQADTVYFASIERLVQDGTSEPVFERALRQRIDLIEREINTDYVGLVVPVSQYVRARGSITDFEHWAQGLQTQVTVPETTYPLMLTAGLISHFVNGSRRLSPEPGFSQTRINQAFLGSYFDLTKPDPFTRIGYTNRIWMQAGLYDYEGARTTGFFDVRYLHYKKNAYLASVGLRSTEGSMALWSPAGGEFDLRLNQLDGRYTTTSVLPDSLLRIDLSAALNRVTGQPDSVITNVDSNTGLLLRAEISYRLGRHWYVGTSLNTIDYRHTLDTFFSPSKYRAIDGWLEYERELLGKWYFRSRATSGMVSYRRNSLSLRFESDLVYRFMNNLSFSINAQASQSVRFLDGSGNLRDDRYRMLIFSGALYWTL